MMNAKVKNANQEGGFTLVEVLIAILITGLLFTGFFAIIRNGIATQLMVREYSDAERVGPAILKQMREDLHNAYFYNISENAAFVGKSVTGGDNLRSDQLHLITTRASLAADDLIAPVNGRDQTSPLTEVSWMMREGEDEFFELARREQPFIDDEPFKGGYVRLISDRVVSMKLQYTGWTFNAEGEEDEEGVTADGGTDAGNPNDAPRLGDDEAEEGADELLWEDDWSSAKKGALPVAVKIELVVSPDVDPDVMRKMEQDGRQGELDRSYVQIILLPQYREDPETMRQTYAWSGSVAEPSAAPTAGAAGARAAGGARGDARGDGRNGRGRTTGGTRRAGGNRTTTTLPSGNGGGAQRLLDIMRGAGR